MGLRPFRDHQVYQEKDKRRLLEEAASLKAEVLMTTEKDALKLGMWPEGRAELLVLAIGVEIPDRAFWELLETKIQPQGHTL